ncbi:dTDP-4-amino-4,6-dideoxygalactose transaminase [Candidatus Pelagibacter sp. HIMB1509]|uniref:dTDP-4-amino-4,6-dideoxygalactose transaminase n=1 Tax=Candidatus Pelagibacter sp. HIMB1509 TaxID=3413339 RepID=UPI003F8435CF
MKTIKYNVAKVFTNEIKNIQKVVKNNHYSMNGNFTKKCQDWIEKNLKVKSSILTNSCTAALEMIAILMNLKKGDEIIMPSYTFVSTANAFVLRGAKPVLVDIEESTLNIDENKIEAAITKKTKAVIVIHYGGISCDLDKVRKITKKHKILLIEDAAHAILSTYKNKPLGSFGDLSTISFHETKNIHCGEGGALLINNPKYIKRSKILRDKGTNRDEFNRNIVKKYSWVDIGSSFGMSEISAAFLYAQLLYSKKITSMRLKIWNYYYKTLKDLKNEKITLPYIPKYSKHNGHIFYIIIRNRDGLLKYLNKNKINCTFHYVPLHQSIAGKKFCKFGKLNKTEILSKSIIRFPIVLDHKILNFKTITKIKNHINKYFQVEENI